MPSTSTVVPITHAPIRRQHIASLAHAKAHEVIALREAKARLAKLSVAPDDFIQSAALVELEDMIREREVAIALMADAVAGHV